MHQASPRKNHPFREVNCAGLDPNLLESQIFGHVKGAFTGAVADRKGEMEAADGGTLFLDEVGTMPRECQAKLLTAIREKVITPVGTVESRKVDVRIIAATNEDLAAKVESGEFRADLHTRLAVVVIRVPPLAERPEDIPFIAEHHLRAQCEAEHVPYVPLSQAALNALQRHSLPGNAAQIENLMRAWVTRSLRRGKLEEKDFFEELGKLRTAGPAKGGGASPAAAAAWARIRDGETTFAEYRRGAPDGELLEVLREAQADFKRRKGKPPFEGLKTTEGFYKKFLGLTQSAFDALLLRLKKKAEGGR